MENSEKQCWHFLVFFFYYVGIFLLISLSAAAQLFIIRSNYVRLIMY